jgi:hypothetical protein
VGAPLQTVCPEVFTKTVGVGFTIIVSVLAAPAQPVAVGVTVITAVIGAVPVFTAVNVGTLPVLLAASPIAGVLFTQLYEVVAATEVPNTIAVEVAPLHTGWLLGVEVTTGDGLMNIVAGCAVPVQPFITGVTVMVAATWVVPAFTAVNGPILPEPEPLIPMVGALFVQL